jgi:catechol 2,3-dioxygenase-like lactoylglutathione lyase family enzyme
MLTRVDRVQIAVRNREAAARRLAALFDAEPVADDTVAALKARRRTVRAGAALFELLEPAATGPVATMLEHWGEGLFAAGFATHDLDALVSRLERHGVPFTAEGEQLFLGGEGLGGLRAVITRDAPPAPAAGALLGPLYEVTMLVPDAAAATARYADVFALDATRFCPIQSELYGYRGTLTLFDPPARLDRIEVVEITDPSRPMGRFYARRGPGLYMCYAEADDIDRLRARLDAAGARHAPSANGAEHGLYIHPSGLLGMLMGVSRTTFAWTWSGRPELVVPR